MKERISKLIDLKSIVTILITIAFIVGFIKGDIDTERFMIIATMIYTFYFAKKKDGEEQ